VLKSSLHRLSYRIDLVTPVVFKITPRHGPRTNTPLPEVIIAPRFFDLETCLPSRCLGTSLVYSSISQSSHSKGSTRYNILLSQIRDSPNLEGQVPLFIPPGTGFPFRRLLRLGGLRWRYSNPPPRGDCVCGHCSAYNFSARSAQYTSFLCCSAIVATETCLFAELLPSDGCLVAYFAVVAWQRVYMPQYLLDRLKQ
jgi:hypothetical protein